MPRLTGVNCISILDGDMFLIDSEFGLRTLPVGGCGLTLSLLLIPTFLSSSLIAERRWSP